MKKTTISSHLTLTPLKRRPKERKTEEWIAIALLCMLTSVSVCLSLYETAPDAAGKPVCLLLAGGCGLLAVALQNRRTYRYSTVGLLLAAVLLSVLCFGRLRSGACVLANHFLEDLAGKNGRIYLRFVGANAADFPFFVLPLTLLAAAISAWSVSTARRWPLFLLVPFLCACILGGMPFGAGAACLLATILFQWLYALRTRTHGDSALALTPLMVLLFAAAVLAVGFAAPCAAALGHVSADLHRELQHAIHRGRYDNDLLSMPEGQLQNLPGWTPGEETALELTMSHPQKLYLRGFVGEHFDGQQWTGLTEEERRQGEDLFYWLHENQFYGQGILANAYGVTGEIQRETMTIRNLSACSYPAYLPYAGMISAMADARQIGDTMICPSGKSYTVAYYPGSIPEWFSLQNTLAQVEKEQEKAPYFVCESAYGQFVAEHDLEIAQPERVFLQQELGKRSSSMTLSQIKDTILAYLDETIRYDERDGTENQDTDFLLYTLQKSGRGYSVHYATAATLLFRYFGVPARYCEGYFLSGKQAERCEPGQPIALSQKHAHAWTEYYLDGVGWIPFEATPGYVDNEELLGPGSGDLGQTYRVQPPTLTMELPQNEDANETPDHNRHLFVLFPILLLMAVLLTAIGVLIYRRICLHRWRTSLNAATNRQAIISCFAYGVHLLEKAGLKENSDCLQSLHYETIRQYQLEALFSSHPMDTQGRAQVQAFAWDSLCQCKKHWSLLQRCYYHWIKCLY